MSNNDEQIYGRASEVVDSSEDPRVAVTDLRRSIEFIEGGRIVFILRGDLGAITFIISTGWEVSTGRYGLAPRTRDKDLYPSSHGVDYHAKFKTECGYHNESCDWMDGDECWGDGSGLAGGRVLRRLIEEGESAVWSELEDFYRFWLEAEAPDAATRANHNERDATATRDPKPNPNPTEEGTQ